jgi:hypothetical protein
MWRPATAKGTARVPAPHPPLSYQPLTPAPFWGAPHHTQHLGLMGNAHGKRPKRLSKRAWHGFLRCNLWFACPGETYLVVACMPLGGDTPRGGGPHPLRGDSRWATDVGGKPSGMCWVSVYFGCHRRCRRARAAAAPSSQQRPRLVAPGLAGRPFVALPDFVLVFCATVAQGCADGPSLVGDRRLGPSGSWGGVQRPVDLLLRAHASSVGTAAPRERFVVGSAGWGLCGAGSVAAKLLAAFVPAGTGFEPAVAAMGVRRGHHGSDARRGLARHAAAPPPGDAGMLGTGRPGRLLVAGGRGRPTALARSPHHPDGSWRYAGNGFSLRAHRAPRLRAHGRGHGGFRRGLCRCGSLASDRHCFSRC